MTVDQLLTDALQLPREQRAELANQLLATLDFDEDFELSEAWLTEVRKRAEELANGHTKPVALDDAFEQAYRRMRDAG